MMAHHPISKSNRNINLKNIRPMKKTYIIPHVEIVSINEPTLLQGSKIYTDDPQSTGNALSRENIFEDEDEW